MINGNHLNPSSNKKNIDNSIPSSSHKMSEERVNSDILNISNKVVSPMSYTIAIITHIIALIYFLPDFFLKSVK